MSEVKSRTLEEANEVLTLAKLNENDINPVSQMIYFADINLHDNDYKLLELDQHILDEINEGQILYVKGNDNENVVLCSNTRTYDVVEAETSNALLLIKDMRFSDDIKDEKERAFSIATVFGSFYEYLEASKGKPHLNKLFDLLNQSIYKGPEYESEINPESLYAYDDLNNLVQASEAELKKALSTMNVVTMNNKIRLLDFEYHFRVLSYMLKLIDENSWPLDEIDYEETINSLKELAPKEILESLFEKYAEDSQIVDGLQLYSYKESEVCKFFAQVLLYGTGKFNLDEFLQTWRESVPEGMAPHEELLHGIAIIDRKEKPSVIFAFSEENLPEDINGRFNELFRIKEKWTVPEITPYIQRLATDKIDVNALLAKYARASKVQGVKYYSAKHPK